MIESLINHLVREAPVIDPGVCDQLCEALRANGDPLAVAIARVVELVAIDVVDPGIALPALAMACATLVDPRLTEREREAARYEIETLLPVPHKGAPPADSPILASRGQAIDRSSSGPDRPDVPVTALNRGPRPRT